MERDDLANQLKVAQTELEDLKQQISKLQDVDTVDSDQLEALRNSKEELESEKQWLESRLEELSTEKDQQEVAFGQTESELAELKSRYEESQQELETARECLIQAEQTLRQLYDAKNELPKEDSEPQADLVASEETESEVVHTKAPEEFSSADAVEHLREMSVWKDDDQPEESSLEPSSEAAAESKEEFAPTSFIEQYGHLLPNDDGEIETNAEPFGTAGQSETTPSTLGTVPEPDALSTEGDDIALESYMQSLMSRVRGDSDTTSYVQPVEPVQTPLQKERELPEPVSVEENEPLDLESLKKSSNKPPLPTDIRAMRELANSSARSAIARHSKKRNRESILSKFVICFITGAVAVYILITANSYTSPMFYGGILAGLISLYCGSMFFSILLDAIREGTPEGTKIAKDGDATENPEETCSTSKEDEPVSIDV